MRHLFACAVLACCLSAVALPAHALELTAPAAGATLRGGSFAVVEWRAARLPANAEEWEAFLSVDDGHYYAFRITPHLDVDLHRFTFFVPNVDTPSARILIRTGDETRETLFEMPATFAIRRDPRADIDPFRVHGSAGRGEAAREGDPAVLEWTDGSRSGIGITQRSAPAAARTQLEATRSHSPDAPTFITPTQIAVGVPPAPVGTVAAKYHALATFERSHRSTDLLLLCRRRNI